MKLRLLRWIDRCVLRGGAAVVLAATLRAAPPAPLAEAVKIGIENQDHWAYTETSEQWDRKGRSQGQTIFRFDPSKPYAEQFTPLKIKGAEPTEKQRADYRKRGEDRGRRLAKRAEAEAKAGEPEKNTVPPTLRFGARKAAIDLEHAQLVEETDARYTYRVPLVAQDNNGLPVDKFELTVSVAKATHALESGTLRLIEPFRAKLVFKLKQGHLTMHWSVVDPRYGPVMVQTEGDLSGSFLLLDLGTTMKTTRTDLKRVKPFDERFKVEVGPLRSLTF